MNFSAVIFQSTNKKFSKKISCRGKIETQRDKASETFVFVLSFLAIICFTLIASKVVKKKTLVFSKNEQVLSFADLLPSPKPYPINKQTILLPELSAQSILVRDVNSGVVLYQKNQDLRLPPASTTKMMTALVAIENYPLDRILIVGEIKIDGNKVGFISGEQITVEDLLYALLVGSANDAAWILAENFAGGQTGFVAAMNQKAVDLRLQNTHFANPVGFDEVDHYSTARDLARLAAVVVENPTLAKIVSTPEITITDVSGTIRHELKNTNELLGKVEGVKGVKTGWTQNAGECLVAWVEKDEKKIVFVVLESKDRFKETSTLIDWVFNNFDWQVIVPASFL